MQQDVDNIQAKALAHNIYITEVPGNGHLQCWEYNLLPSIFNDIMITKFPTNNILGITMNQKLYWYAT